jgi:hypothetical protein
MQITNQLKATNKSSIEIRDLNYSEEIAEQDEYNLYGGIWIYHSVTTLGGNCTYTYKIWVY